MRNQIIYLFGSLAIGGLSGCGDSKPPEEAQSGGAATSLVAPEFKSQAPAPTPADPGIDPAEEDAPITLADAEASVRAMANLSLSNFDPVEASRKLRQAATSMTFNVPNVGAAEKNRLETVSHHLRKISADLRSTDENAVEDARNALKAMTQMYLP